MLEKLLTGPKTYYLWLLFLLAVIAGCGLVYLQQLQEVTLCFQRLYCGYFLS